MTLYALFEVENYGYDEEESTLIAVYESYVDAIEESRTRGGGPGLRTFVTPVRLIPARSPQTE